MLNPEQLTERLSMWSSSFQLENPKAFASPILLYQSLFGLMHNLKSSVQLSEHPEIVGLLQTVINSESLLKTLSINEVELDASANKALRKLAGDLMAIEAVEVLLTSATEKAQPLPVLELKLFELKYPWEALSRGRAMSCARHGYGFYKVNTSLKLNELTQYDSQFKRQIAPVGGIDVVRKLEPSASSPKSGDLLLDVEHLVAFPNGTERKLILLPSAELLS